MKGGQPKTKEEKPDPANLDASELASNQEAKVIPWFCGTRKIACTWISQVHNQYHKNAPTAGKK